MTEPVLPRLVADDPGLRSRHLLALPEGIAAEEVEVLAASRFTSVRWEDVLPEAATASARTERRPLTAALGIRSVAAVAPVRALRVGRLTTLVGPYRVEREDTVALGLPTSTAVVYDVHAPVERGPLPFPGGDRDGLKRAFPDGLPVREEERVLQWLVAAARRLGGAVRTGTNGVVLTPDTDGAIDLTVLTARWLEPEQVLAAVQRVAPRARLSVAASEWHGPMPGSGRAALRNPGMPEPGGSGLGAALVEHGLRDEELRGRVLAESEAYDAYMRANPPMPEGYGVLVDLGVDGMVAVEAGVEHVVPPIMRELPWAQAEVVAYRVRWEPLLIEELEAERPSLEHRVARGRAVPQVQAIARVVHALAGGEIADESGFLVDPEDL
ncbi:hypothetical protein [Cellulomonas soli]|uniref:Uncharacterized protein n=1 Tax=Cellulomonas soli TaxID=931535 RepID=A0A512PEG8_9CELL|nr:hypothetical protein [Cellulomonas soli]NYI58912.1 hypothetical protein [Cellulomonas soli]GEP69595.1 hypothetical protein CSO01_23100 [Cellulomonas soli]